MLVVSGPGRRPSCAVGLGQSWHAIVRGIPAPFPLFAVTFNLACRASQVGADSPKLITAPLGVGQAEQPLSTVRRANFLRRVESERRVRIEAVHSVSEDNQLGKHLPKSKVEMPRDVLEEDESGLDLPDDSLDVRPQVPRVIGAKALAGRREGLARVARSDEIHDAAPRAAVEGCEIVPDRCKIQGLVFHPLHEEGRAVCFPLDVTCSSILLAQGQSDAELKSAIPGTKSQTIHASASAMAAASSS